MNKETYIEQYLFGLSELLQDKNKSLRNNTSRVIDIIIDARKDGRTIFMMGNGGSASTSSHFACDLTKLTACPDKPRIKAISLNDCIPTMLAVANDNGYENIFSEQLKALMTPGDVVIGISGSGNSPNVLKGVEYANSMGGTTIGMTGFDGGKLMVLAKENIYVPTNSMQYAEDAHLFLTHIIAAYIRDCI